MIQELRFAKINTDVNSHDIQPDEGEYRMMENLAPPQRGKGYGFVRESLKGTIGIPIEIPEGVTFKCIGTYEEAPRNRMFFMIHADSGLDYIYVYDAATQTTKRLLETSVLDWSNDTIITGIAVLDDVIYWTDPTMRYFKVQDDTQFAQMRIALGPTDSSLPVWNVFFQVTSQNGSVSVSTTVNIPVDTSATDAAILVADALNADPSVTAHFNVSLDTGATVVRVEANSTTGNWFISNSIGPHYHVYLTNYDTIPNDEDDFRQYPVPPLDRPTADLVVDWPTVGADEYNINQIIGRNWQFSFRQIYLNNQITVLSPYSEIVLAGKFPDDILDTSLPNKIEINFDIENISNTRSVELLVRTSEINDWFIVKTFLRDEFRSSGVGLTYVFEGTEQQTPVATADAIKQQEQTPRASNSLSLVKNKLFCVDDLTGYSYDDGDMELSFTLVDNVGSANNNRRWLKDGGLYNVGVRFFDGEMRTDGTVHKATQVNVTSAGGTDFVEALPANPSGKRANKRKSLDITLSGRPPIWARHWVYVISDELRFASFVQCHVWVHHYVRPQRETDDPSSDTTHYYMYGNQYILQSAITDREDWRYLHFQIPTNIPYAVQRGMQIRIDGATGLTNLQRYATVLDVVGTMVVVEKLEFDQNAWGEGIATPIEIYTTKEQIDTFSFYEFGNIQTVQNPGTDFRSFLPVAFDVVGSALLLNNADEQTQWKYDWDDYTTSGSDEDDKGLNEDKFTYGNFESYTPSYRPTQVLDAATGEEVVRGEQTDFEYEYDFGYINDQTLATRNLGRPAPLLQNVQEQERSSVIKWSNDYVDNAQINGLHTFEPLNEYALPLERGAIQALVRASEDVMLAIHSSAVTSLYIGKGVIRSADLNPTLVTTDSVIGTDNELKYSYGTVHPESVCEVDGNVYFWDGVRNEPVRYGQNGLTPMATTFGARVFFKDTIPATFGNTENYTCFAEYDRLLNMVFFTFNSDTDRFTIGFHESTKAWIGKYSFTPENYGVIGDQFIGFVNGVPWLHNQDDNNHNTFYGLLYPSKAHFVINQGGHMEKAWDGIMIDSNKRWDCPMIYNNENQVTSLLEEDFVWRDQLYYADFLRDLNTDPQLLSVGQIALRHGKFMSSQILDIEMELESSDPHYLHSVAVASTLKPGHMVQQE